MPGIFLLPALVQMVAMVADEGWFHRKRGLPRWERNGHPLDTLTVAMAYAWLAWARPGDRHALTVYLVLALFSCVFVTKDEFVHSRLCGPGESWLHAILFVLHPLVFAAFGVLWWTGGPSWIVRAQLALTLAFGGYQVLYWSVLWNPKPKLSDP
jgi:hypothetical protein